MKIATVVTFLIGLMAGGVLFSAVLGAAGGRPLLQLCPIPSGATNAVAPAPAAQDATTAPR